MEDVLGSTVITQGSKEIKLTEALKDTKYIGILFGAHWAPCCRSFTEEMITDYKLINKDAKVLELIFVSKDGNQDAFDRNFGDMLWKAIKYDDEARKKSLVNKYCIMEIPALIILNSATGELVSKTGRLDVQKHSLNVV